MSSPEAKPPKVRHRAKRACKLCNSRRVKCNVTERQPCDNCKAAKAPCELISSRRGKYDRHPLRQTSHLPSALSSESLAPPSQYSLYAPVSQARESNDGPSPRFMLQTAPPESSSPAADANKVLHPGRDSLSFHASPAISSHAREIQAESTTVFLGESSSISLVHDTKGSPNTERSSVADNTRLRYPIPDAVKGRAPTTLAEAHRKDARIAYLTQDGAFHVPSHGVCEVLFRAYFAWHHPCYPILDRYNFGKSYAAKTLSSLLLQAVLFVGASHCNEKALQEIGLPDRYDARSTFYNRAKDLYDVDYEHDKLIVAQAVFLMSFWRAGPLLEKDARHWIGAAITLAQTKGMHRSSSHVSSSDNRLRKRIWWSLYVRDRQGSSALGLPTRIRDDDCDIEMLEISDFEEEDDGSVQPEYLGRQNMEHILYAIHMAKLAKMLGVIVLREYAPRSLPKNEVERSIIQDDLQKWLSELSPEMSLGMASISFWAGSLHITFNNLEILLHRSAYLAQEEIDEQTNSNPALTAACRTTRIVEDMLSQNLVQHGNVHLITGLFNSLCIHTIHLRRSSSTVRKLAEYRAQLCLLGLRELQNTWDVTNWVLQLFFQFLDKSTAKKLRIVDGEEPLFGTAAVAAIPARDVSVPAFSPPRPAGDRYLVDGMDFASHLFGSREAEDFSMYQLQPDLFTGDGIFDMGLDQYYDSRR